MGPWLSAPALAGAFVVALLAAVALMPIRVRAHVRLQARFGWVDRPPEPAAGGGLSLSALPALWPRARGAVVAELSLPGLRVVGRGRAWVGPEGWRAIAAGRAMVGSLTLRQWRHRTGGPTASPLQPPASTGRREAGQAARPSASRADTRKVLRVLWGALPDRLRWERLVVGLRVGTGEAMGTALTAGALRAAAFTAAARLPGARAFAPRLRLEVWPDFRRRGVAMELQAAASVRAGQAVVAELLALRACRADRSAPQRARAHTAYP